jgi:hypothetical protein
MTAITYQGSNRARHCAGHNHHRREDQGDVGAKRALGAASAGAGPEAATGCGTIVGNNAAGAALAPSVDAGTARGTIVGPRRIPVGNRGV